MTLTTELHTVSNILLKRLTLSKSIAQHGPRGSGLQASLTSAFCCSCMIFLYYISICFYLSDGKFSKINKMDNSSLLLYSFSCITLIMKHTLQLRFFISSIFFINFCRIYHLLTYKQVRFSTMFNFIIQPSTEQQSHNEVLFNLGHYNPKTKKFLAHERIKLNFEFPQISESL